MPGMDIFNSDPFSLQSMTARVNKGTYRPGQISARGVFAEDGVSTTIVSVEERNGHLALVEPSQRGGPGETTTNESRRLIPINVPHYQRDDSVYADEVQNVRAFGSESDAEIVQDRVDAKTMKHAGDLTMTLEHQRVGALKGIVVSKSGAVQVNLFTAFGISAPAAISLELDSDSTKVGSLVQSVKYAIEDALDAPYTGIRVYTGRTFHASLWAHPTVRDTFLNTPMAKDYRESVPDVFTFSDVVWERYKTGAKATTDLGAAYIADTDAYVIVEGVPDLYITRFAPADYVETVNTKGLPFYAKQYLMPNGKGVNLEVQMNAISLCTQPGATRRLTLT